MEVTRQQLGAGGSAEFRARQLRARDMLRGELEGPDLERHVEQSMLTTTMEKAGRWAVGNANFPLSFGLACCAIEWMSHIGPRLDIARFGFEARAGDAAPGRHDLPVGPDLDQDGAGHPARLRADARAALRGRDGRLLVVDGRVQQLRDRARRQVPARRPPRPGLPAAPRVARARDPQAARGDPLPPTEGWRTRYGGVGTEEVVGDLSPRSCTTSMSPAARLEPRPDARRPGTRADRAGAARRRRRRGARHGLLPRPGRRARAPRAPCPRRCSASRSKGYAFLASVHGVDYFPEEPRLGVHYELLDMVEVDRICVRTRVTVDDPHVPSVTPSGRPPTTRSARSTTCSA